MNKEERRLKMKEEILKLDASKLHITEFLENIDCILDHGSYDKGKTRVVTHGHGKDNKRYNVIIKTYHNIYHIVYNFQNEHTNITQIRNAHFLYYSSDTADYNFNLIFERGKDTTSLYLNFNEKEKYFQLLTFLADFF